MGFGRTLTKRSGTPTVGRTSICSTDSTSWSFLPENDRIRYTVSTAARKEILRGLLALNHERHAEEVAAGLVDENGKLLKKRGAEAPSRTTGNEETKGRHSGRDETALTHPASAVCASFELWQKVIQHPPRYLWIVIVDPDRHASSREVQRAPNFDEEQ